MVQNNKPDKKNDSSEKQVLMDGKLTNSFEVKTKGDPTSPELFNIGICVLAYQSTET